MELISIDLIDGNPFQPREGENPEHVEKVAQSIADQGLLQVPVGRQVDGRVQLAFGHTRLAAFAKLANGHPGGGINSPWAKMPVAIQDLTDQQMFELAISENMARNDLTPVEQARAMLVYREKFGKTSVEIGRLFGLSESAVRNKLRLLDLPETVQKQLDVGDIAEHTARKLMVLQKLAPDRIEELTERLVANEVKSPEEVTDLVRNEIWEAIKVNRSSLVMWDGRWKRGEQPRGGNGLWPLAWTPDELPAPKFAELQKVYQGPQEFRSSPDIAGTVRVWNLKQFFEHAKYFSDHEREEHAARVGGTESFFNLLDQLANPPACTACPFHSVLDGTHYCGLKVCWTRKRKAWYEQELERIFQETGIPIYDPETETKEVEEASTWQNSESWEKWWKEKADHLRLRARYQDYNPHALTESHVVQVVSIRPQVAEKRRKAMEREAGRDQSWEIARRNRVIAKQFMAEAGAAAFEPLLAGIKPGVLAVLARAFGATVDQLTGRLIERLVPWDEEERGPVVVANYLAGVAKEAGITLPEDWLEIAEKYQEQAK